jgi:hypothetical protein
MPTVTLLEKLYSSASPEIFEKQYSSLLSGLDVQIRFVGTTDRGWIQLEVSGKDENIAISFLDREAGLASTALDEIKKFSVLQGRIISSGKTTSELHVEIGTLQVLNAALSEKCLQAQLADGKNIPLPELVELFCLYDNLPLEIKIAQNAKAGKNAVKAQLSDAQLSMFSRWVRNGFDRLIVLGSTFSDVEHAVKFSKHSRDTIKTESLGVLEQVIICKLGTDAVGLIPKLGRFLKSAVLVPFSPKKITEALGNQHFG